jgi:hypothetical protein
MSTSLTHALAITPATRYRDGLIEMEFYDGQPTRFGKIVSQPVKGLMALTDGVEGWVGYVFYLDAERWLLLRQDGFHIFYRDEVELVQFFVQPEGSIWLHLQE